MAEVSMRDVAKHARVSVGTVSNVMNHPEKVSDAAISRVTA
jgi:LacI family transcriptional regulator